MTWTAILAMGLATWLIRFSFLGLVGDRPLPPWVLRHIRYTGVAVMPGLVALALRPGEAGADPAAMLGCAVAVAVGAWRRDTMIAVAAGAATYALARLAA